jgi:hypothetical protein
LDLRVLVTLCLIAAIVAAGAGIACLLRLDELERNLQTPPRPRRRQQGGLRGWGRVLPLPGRRR